MKKTLLAVALAAAPFVSSASEANGIGYTHIQLDGVYEEADGFYGKGAGLSGSYAFTDNFFVTGSYARTKDSDGDRFGDYRYSYDVTHKAWSLGAGFNQAIGNRADWVAQLAYVRHDGSIEGSVCERNVCASDRDSDHISGYNLSTGVRGRVTDSLSANAYVGYEDYNHHYDGDFYADFGMGYAFNPTWSLQTGVRLADEAQTWKLGVRASF